MFEKSTSDARPNTEEQAEPKPANPNHIRQDFYRLALDWLMLHTRMPKPVATSIRRSRTLEYGHPAEWASDQAAHITDILASWHELVADHRNETPPPPATSCERIRVVRAWRYLEPRIEQLCTLVDAEDLKELAEIHQRIRTVLKLDDEHELWLPIECGRCQHKTVFSGTGQHYGRLRCHHCGVNEDEALRDFHIHRTLGQVIDRYDQLQHAESDSLDTA